MKNPDMKGLAEFLSGIDAQRYLRIVVLALICLTFANAMFSVMGHEFGLGYRSFLTGPDDRYADLVKLALSFKNVSRTLETQKGFDSWPPLFKYYYFYNPYAGREGLAKGWLTHFHLPPLTALLSLLSSALIVQTGSPRFVLWLFFALYLFGVYCLTRHTVRMEERTMSAQLAIWYVCLLGYPALFLLTRANYYSGLTSLLIMHVLISLFGYEDDGIGVSLALAVAVNVRPNSAIFVLAFPVALGIQRSLKPCARFLAMALGLAAACYFSVHWLYPDYTISAFLQGVRIYNWLFMVGPGGDCFNSSLFAFVKNLDAVSLRLLNSTGVGLVFDALAFTVVLGALWGLWRSASRRLIAPFVLTALYCLVTPVFADYHLLVFLAPLLLLALNRKDWAGHYRAVSAIALASILVLSPKNYIFLNGYSLQTIFNPLILCLAILYLATLPELGVPEPSLA